MDVLHRHLGPGADRYIDHIRAVAPEFADVNVEFPFGELYARAACSTTASASCAPWLP